MMRLVVLAVVFTPILGIYISQNKCEWKGARYGEFIQCRSNQVALGSCGSGRNADCGYRIWDKLLCCDLPGFQYTSCTTQGASAGEHLSCLNQGYRPLVLGASCGSGRNRDCHGNHHEIKCCEGTYNRRPLRIPQRCYWKHARYGKKITCNSNDEAIFGRCGSGSNADCERKNWLGIQCCKLIV